MLQPYYFSISRSLIFQRIDNVAAMNFLAFSRLLLQVTQLLLQNFPNYRSIRPIFILPRDSLRLTASTTTEVQLRRNRRHSSKLYSINDRWNYEKLSLCVYAVLARLSNNATSSSTSEKDASTGKRSNDRRTPNGCSRRSAGVKGR